ncbi:hypothetical protein PVW46_04380, partial [Mameliella sp. AT18]|uniref:hypothetical protein n=1 Tax=Mameliella sp. AT18 TaxID=3028385 RepID=UPI00237BE44B
TKSMGPDPRLDPNCRNSRINVRAIPSATNNFIIDVKFGKSVAEAATLPVIPSALENGVKQHAPRPTRWHVRADQVWML